MLVPVLKSNRMTSCAGKPMCSCPRLLTSCVHFLLQRKIKESLCLSVCLTLSLSVSLSNFSLSIFFLLSHFFYFILKFHFNNLQLGQLKLCFVIAWIAPSHSQKYDTYFWKSGLINKFFVVCLETDWSCIHDRGKARLSLNF